MADSDAPQNKDVPLDFLAMIGRGVVPPVLHDRTRRAEMGLPEDDDTHGRYMVELNILYRGGLREAAKAFEELCRNTKELGDTFMRLRKPIEISKSYFQVELSVTEWRALLKRDDDNAKRVPGSRVIYKLWPDFPVKALVDRSVATVKADAAFKSYSATGAGIVWAVIDSGIDGTHPHFGTASAADAEQKSVIHHPSVADLHYDFTRNGAPDEGAPLDDDLPVDDGTEQAREARKTAVEVIEKARHERSRKAALVDGLGHGTHVAGIIAGQLPEGALPWSTASPDGKLRYAVFEQVFEADHEAKRIWGKLPVQRKVQHPEAIHGVAPDCLLVSLKVLNKEGKGRVSDIMRALVYVREDLNDDPKMLRVHGVNLSVGYDFDAQMFACGQSPLCVEVDRLVKSGVVVVTAAGNTGYGSVGAMERNTKVGLSNTINDPGNAALAITVGSTHRDAPHTYGVSYFSSKGPTGDGRLKPDLVAPGERITSCAAKAKCDKLGIAVDGNVATYIDDSGTSMAAPHVSGAIAAFLSIRREFIQRPEEVKRIFLATATSLGRERYFEGHGLVDLMRAIQSV
jgi:subtilisin family serine protease